MSKVAILDGVTELATVTIGSVTAVIDAGTSSVKVGAQASGASGKYYNSGTTTIAFAGNYFALGFVAQGIFVENNKDSTEDIEISFDGINVHDTIIPGEKTMYDNRHEAGVYVRSASGGMAFDVGAW